MFQEKKRIYRAEFEELLRFVPDISPEEKKYLNQVFARDLIDGLTEFEIRRKIEGLKFDYKDQIDQWEAERVKQKLLSVLGKK
jgi:hypothetical protein